MRFERAVLRATKYLPARALDAFSNRVGPVDRSNLDPHFRFILALADAIPSMKDRFTIEGGTAERGRKIFREVVASMDPVRVSLPEVVDHSVKMDDGDEILVRRYCPADPFPRGAAILYFHGGGFVVGSVEVYDRICRYVANRIGVVVLSVDYRLAPEHPAPRAADDGLAAWRWLLENADGLGLDPQRLGVMGDSAGGCVSAVVAQQAKLSGLPMPALQVLVCPITDGSLAWPSVQEFGEGFGLGRATLQWFNDHYFHGRSEETVEDYLVSPLRNPDLSGLPPAVLLTAIDPLRDEGLEYGRKLRADGVDVASLDYPEVTHPFFIMTGAVPAAKKVMNELCDETASSFRLLI